MDQTVMDFLQTLIPVLSVVLKLAPQFVDDAKKLAEALKTHQNPDVQGGAAHIEAAIAEATKAD